MHILQTLQQLTSVDRDFRISLAWAALACVIRPTNALLWGFLGLRLLYKTTAYRNAIIANTAIVL